YGQGTLSLYVAPSGGVEAALLWVAVSPNSHQTGARFEKCSVKSDRHTENPVWRKSIEIGRSTPSPSRVRPPPPDLIKRSTSGAAAPRKPLQSFYGGENQLPLVWARASLVRVAMPEAAGVAVVLGADRMGSNVLRPRSSRNLEDCRACSKAADRAPHC